MAKEPRPSNVDRSLFNAPNEQQIEFDNLTAVTTDQPQSIEDIEVIMEDDGGATIDFAPDEMLMGQEPEDFYGNLAELVSSDTLGGVLAYVMSSVDDDKSSRDEWEDAYTKGLKLLGLRYEDRTQPFEGATGVTHPILNEAVTQFQAGAYKEMLPSTGPVKANIVGLPNPQVEAQARRVQEYMNYQIMYEMQEYEPEFDQMLYFLGLAGSAFKKIYRDDSLGRPVSRFIPAEDVIVPYSATDVATADRITHVFKLSENEFRKLQVAGVYSDMPIKSGSEDTDEITQEYDRLEGREPSGPSEHLTFFECHCFLDLPEYSDLLPDGTESGIKLPYIVTVCKDSSDVVSIRRNYLQDDPKKDKIEHFVQYKFTPGLGFYGFGLIHLLGNLSRTATSNLRQLIDSGTLANMPSGFKARGLRIADDDNPLQPGEFRDVDVPGGDLRTSLIPLPYKEPSATLFQLMGFVVESAQRFIGNTDIGIADGNKEMPVGTTIALLERGARIVSAVHKRLHNSLKQELKMLARLFAEDPQPYPYETGVDAQIKTQDFDARVDILPVSDPNIFSMSQRVVLAQEQLKLAQAAPELHNLHEAYYRVYSALGVQNIEQMLKPEPQEMPRDPATENQEASAAAGGQGKLQVFRGQDHQAHIAVHMAYMRTKVAQMQPPVLLVLEKHIYDHLGMQAREMAEQQMAANPQASQLPPEQTEALVAQIQAQLITQFQQQYPPQDQEKDPLVAIKEQELQLRQQDQVADQQIDQQRLALDQQRQAQNMALGRERIESAEELALMRMQQQAQRQTGG
ncbi:MAG: hypothetical protein Unbinned4834contig1000_53 [Prokaryotic dsDNA virus sp.]|nr:MAG: hypothetical protein Unbinned4834contig1000_53 [Prokaryotic dsDNA virus sp.]|tara:strand:- start:17704 stop:20088 length:2385 start_codon:yes stop_codon:yes gene_type:complete